MGALAPSLIVWLREKIGNPLPQGWRPYGNWANAPGGVEEEYLPDDAPRLYDGTDSSGQRFPVEDGLRELRKALAVPGASVRLVGLSGTGKTRLAQALFDGSVGDRDHALNPDQTIYTDISDEPTPAPRELATRLINDRERIILVIDNCSPELHRSLTQEIRSGQDSTVSLLTMEYDVRDDLPGETRVFRLEPASDDIIEELIRKRYPDIGQNNAETIAGFSGGNARVAIALAGTVQKGDTLSGLHDRQLFERLFRQRHAPNEALLVSAQLCSLVYSFEGEDTHSDESELRMLASLADKPVNELYRHVAELEERDLIQSRGRWRAVLPHAIANRLAREALKSIPTKTIVDGFLGGPERLMTSFTRRLGYLHDSKEAVGIVNGWLAEGGWIAESIHKLVYFSINVLSNIAPVSPEKTLAAIEQAASGADGEAFVTVENRHAVEFAHLLRHLAYDSSLFNRSVTILSRYALSEYRKYKNENIDRYHPYKTIQEILQSLFYIYHSGTHAPFETRASLIEELVDSGDPDEQELGLILLDAALKTQHFISDHEFDFGARPRDYGYHPNTREEIVEWFDNAIRLCLRLALSDRSVSGKARKLLASKLRGLWTTAGMVDALEEAAAEIHAQHPWNDGWIAVCKIIRFDSGRLPDDINQRLQALEERLKPDDLLQKARTFALSDRFELTDVFDDGEEDDRAANDRMRETTRSLGAEVAQNEEILTELLPDLVSTQNTTQNTGLYSFGSGLAEGCLDEPERLKALYEAIYQAIEAAPYEQRKISVLCGFLSACAKEARSFYDSTLDALIDDAVLGEWFPIIQATSTIDSRGLERLHKALEQERAGIHRFQYLARGCLHESVSDDDLAALIEQILSKEQGIHVALEILRTRFRNQGEEGRPDTGKLMVMARQMLSSYDFEEDKPSQTTDYRLAVIAAACLGEPGAAGAARDLCQRLATASSKYRVFAFGYPRLLIKLAQLQPGAFLDIFLGGEDAGDDKFRTLFSSMIDPGGRRKTPMAQIPDDTLLAWCEEAPSSRYALISSAITAFRQSADTEKPEWNPIVDRILDKAPDLDPVIKNLADGLWPTRGRGLRAGILEERSVLWKELFDHENDEVKKLSRRQYDSLREAIGREREREQEREDNYRYDTFPGERASGISNELNTCTDSGHNQPANEEQELIAAGESDRVEFKSFLRYDPDPRAKSVNKVNKKTEYVIAKTIAAFLNSEGGDLFIGIDDEGNALGLEDDIQTLGKNNRDGFNLHLGEIIRKYIGGGYSTHVKITFPVYDDVEICRVQVAKSLHNPVFIKFEDKQDFFIRSSCSSIPLSPEQQSIYEKEHWPPR